MAHDDAERLVDAVAEAASSESRIYIQGEGSKGASGVAEGGKLLSTVDHSGIIEYRPDELVITARAGTPLREIVSVLAAEQQMLPCDPPQFGDAGTLGGAIACGYSGPGRPWMGSVRDCLLGVEVVNGIGERLVFGGQVMKNVAGYDVSRLMVGARGSLGLLLSASIKVLPRPEVSHTLGCECSRNEAHGLLAAMARKPVPLTGTCYVDGRLHVRLSGSHESVNDAEADLGMASVDDEGFWNRLRDHEHEFFKIGGPLWRCSLARGVLFDAPGDAAALVEWGGAQVWWRTDEPIGVDLGDGGHVMPFKRGSAPAPDGAMARYVERLRDAFDPKRVFNRGVAI